MESSENSPLFGTGLVLVWFSCFWVGSDGKSSIVSSIVGWGTFYVGVVEWVVCVSIVDLCSSVAGGICDTGVSSITMGDFGI